jgi:hypothetical protein
MIRDLNLGIITDCVHYITSEGNIGTENHILLRQLEALSTYFKTTTICCPVVKSDKTKVLSFYKQKVNFLQIPQAGGDRVSDKLELIRTIPVWLKSFKKLDRIADIIYQRFPNNLNIPGALYYFLKKKKFLQLIRARGFLTKMNP